MVRKGAQRRPWGSFAKIVDQQVRGFFKLDKKKKSRAFQMDQKARRRYRKTKAQKRNHARRVVVRELHKVRRARGQNRRTGRR